MKAFATRKPGVSFIMRTGRALSLNLRRLGGMSPPYAYNVPRPRFDAELRAKAEEEGARIVKHRAGVVLRGDRVELDGATLDACGLRRQPDLVIDATGRARVLGRALGLAGVAGRRKDTAIFAHYADVDLGVPLPGSVVLTAMNAGWSWRIPLPDRMSVGVVQDTARLGARGATPEARLDAALAADERMSVAMARSRRLTGARVFTNYQWRYDRLRGPNWALVGDAAGFVDPTLSSGVLLALTGAAELAAAIRGERVEEELVRWEDTSRRTIALWQELVDTFYDGRLFAMIMQGEDLAKNTRLDALSHHMERNIAGAVLGARTTHWYSRRLVSALLNHGIVRYRPAEWAIR